MRPARTVPLGFNSKRYAASRPVTTSNLTIHHRTARTLPLKAGTLCVPPAPPFRIQFEAVRRKPSGNDTKPHHPSPNRSHPSVKSRWPWASRPHHPFGCNSKRYGASRPVTTRNFSIHHRAARTLPLKAGTLCVPPAPPFQIQFEAVRRKPSGNDTKFQHPSPNSLHPSAKSR